MTPVELVLDRLQKVRKTSRGWSACCPAHDDKSPSLSIAEGADGRVLFTCWSHACKYRDIMAAIGLNEVDGFVGQRSERKYPSTKKVLEEVYIVRIVEGMLATEMVVSDTDRARYQLALKRLEQCKEANSARA